VSAAMMEEEDVEMRVARLESDVAHMMKLDIRELRHVAGDVKDVVASLRDELHSSIGELRDAMNKCNVSLREAIEVLRHEMTRSSLSHKVWMLLSNGAMLAVMARGFKWL
jgi:hypothetical protein